MKAGGDVLHFHTLKFSAKPVVKMHHMRIGTWITYVCTVSGAYMGNNTTVEHSM